MINFVINVLFPTIELFLQNNRIFQKRKLDGNNIDLYIIVDQQYINH